MSGALTRFFYGGFCQFWFTGIHNQSEGVVTREYGLLQEYLYSKIQTDNLSIPDRDSKALLYRILYYLSSGGRIFILVLSVCVCVEVFIPYDLIFFFFEALLVWRCIPVCWYRDCYRIVCWAVWTRLLLLKCCFSAMMLA